MKAKKAFKFLFSNPIFAIVFLVGLVLVFSFWQKQKNSNTFKIETEIEINSNKIEIKIADNAKERYRGLSGLKKIPPSTGMLFKYDNLTYCPHVMRGMNFGLDFVFLKENKIVDLKEKIPADFVGTIQSGKLCNQVLELNSEEIEKFKLKIGDNLKFNENY